MADTKQRCVLLHRASSGASTRLISGGWSWARCWPARCAQKCTPAAPRTATCPPPTASTTPPPGSSTGVCATFPAAVPKMLSIQEQDLLYPRCVPPGHCLLQCKYLHPDRVAEHLYLISSTLAIMLVKAIMLFSCHALFLPAVTVAFNVWRRLFARAHLLLCVSVPFLR